MKLDWYLEEDGTLCLIVEDKDTRISLFFEREIYNSNLGFSSKTHQPSIWTTYLPKEYIDKLKKHLLGEGV